MTPVNREQNVFSTHPNLEPSVLILVSNSLVIVMRHYSLVLITVGVRKTLKAKSVRGSESANPQSAHLYLGVIWLFDCHRLILYPSLRTGFFLDRERSWDHAWGHVVPKTLWFALYLRSNYGACDHRRRLDDNMWTYVLPVNMRKTHQ